MNANLASSVTACPVPQMARGLILLFAFSCGAIVANLYYAQPIIALIAPDLHMSGGMASLIVSLTQIGYAAGLFFLVPLGDLVENKKLMVVTALMSIASLALAATVRAPGLFLAVSLIVGFSSVAVQLLIPLAAHLAPSESRGRVVGTIMSGLLLGILLSRPVASFIADHFGWRAVFAFGAATMAIVTVLLMLTVPSRRPAHQATYMQLIRSLGRLVATQPVLRERSLYQGLMFGSFSLFWSAAPVELMHHHHLSQSAIALFSLVGAMGASSAPIAGRLADAGHTRRATVVALGLAAASFAPALFVPGAGVAGLVATGILLDFAVQMNMVLGQREIYALDAHSRNRLNSIYMTSIFVGGAIGSALASALYEHGGWTWIATVGALFPLAALARFAFASRAAR
ncbi:MFS transporter [Burkholderia pseudomallei]|uniref:MFS transporter n=1 Tax=Burkholderia pseudomallei TaxID=28450 RepID=UPI00057253F8|nr:MFS transporter [Burkholderia pseudomallei]